MDRKVIAQSRKLLFMGIALASIATVSLHAQGSENQPVKNLPLAGTRWSLISINKKTVPQNGFQPRLELQESKTVNERLTEKTSGILVNASDGCNQMLGGYKIDGSYLHITSGPATLRACGVSSNASYEMLHPISFWQALRLTSQFEIHGSTLVLLDRDGEVLARLSGVNSN